MAERGHLAPGIALLILVFYMGDAALMTDPAVSSLSGAKSIGVGVGVLLAAWVGYDLVWRSPLRFKPTAGFVVSLAWILALSAVLFATLSGRAAYIHVGVMLGTIMTGNVWMVIMPSQRELVNATIEGREQDPAIGLQAKTRSVHNNYFTFPLLFIMLSGHFPQTYDHRLNWLALLVLAVGSAVIRHAMNIRFTYRAWKVPATVALFVTLAVTLFLFAHPTGFARVAPRPPQPPTAWADVAPIFQSRCEPCHATLPTNTAFPTAPNGVVLENEHLARRWKDKILQRVVVLRNMPLANLTQMTDAERDRIGAWIDQGCR
ncbi:MAG: urate hydroxylase PuuD [Polyangiales bacterium]